MKAYYYYIFDKVSHEIVDRGIIRDIEDTIYPQQNTGIEELPFECPCHHFHAEGYNIGGFSIDIPARDIHNYHVNN